MRDRAGFSIFELLSVLTVIGIALVISLGSYHSWSTVHAVSGAAKTICEGLREARSLARAKGRPVSFWYGACETNDIRARYAFQISVCTNEFVSLESVAEKGTLPFSIGFHSAAPLQRFSDAVQVEHIDTFDPETGSVTTANERETVFFFRTDGSILDSYTAGELGKPPHRILVSSRDLFPSENGTSRSLFFVISVDPCTGTVTREEVRP